MRKALLALSACLVLAALCGCGLYSAPVMPPGGLVYSSIHSPLSTEFDGKTPLAPKGGSATCKSVLGLVAFGDCSLDTAARSEGLTTIHYADYSYYSILGLYTEFTVTVYGE